MKNKNKKRDSKTWKNDADSGIALIPRIQSARDGRRINGGKFNAAVATSKPPPAVLVTKSPYNVVKSPGNRREIAARFVSAAQRIVNA